MRKTTKFYLLVALVLLLVHGSSSEHEFERETRHIQENNDLHPDKVLVDRQDYKSQNPVSHSSQQDEGQIIDKTPADHQDNEPKKFNKETPTTIRIADPRQSSRGASRRFRRCGTRSNDRHIERRSNSVPLQTRKVMDSDADARRVHTRRETVSVNRRVTGNRRQSRTVDARVKETTQRQLSERTSGRQSQGQERRSMYRRDNVRRNTHETRRDTSSVRRNTHETRRDTSSVLRERTNRRTSSERRVNDVSKRQVRAKRDVSRRDSSSVDRQEYRRNVRHRSSESINMRASRVTRRTDGRYSTFRNGVQQDNVQRERRSDVNRRVNIDRRQADRRSHQRCDSSSDDRSHIRRDAKGTRRSMERAIMPASRHATRQAISTRRDTSSMDRRSSSRRITRDRVTPIDTRVTRTRQQRQTRRLPASENRQTRSYTVRDTRRSNEGSKELYRNRRNTKRSDENNSRRYRRETRSVDDSRAGHYNRQDTRRDQRVSVGKIRQIRNANRRSNERRVNSNNEPASDVRHNIRRNIRNRRSIIENRLSTRQSEERHVTSRRISSESSTRRTIIEKGNALSGRSAERRINFRRIVDNSKHNGRSDAKQLDRRILRDRSSVVNIMSRERRSTNARSFDGRNPKRNVIHRTDAFGRRSKRATSVRASSVSDHEDRRKYEAGKQTRNGYRRVLETTRSNRMSAHRDTSRRSINGASRASRRSRLSIRASRRDERRYAASYQRRSTERIQTRSAERIQARHVEYSRMGRRATYQMQDRRVQSSNRVQQHSIAKDRTIRGNTRRYSEPSNRRQHFESHKHNRDERRTLSDSRRAMVRNSNIQHRREWKSFSTIGSRIGTMHRSRRDTSTMDQRRHVTESSGLRSSRRVNRLSTRRMVRVPESRMHVTETRVPTDLRLNVDELFTDTEYPAANGTHMLQELFVDTNLHTGTTFSNTSESFLFDALKTNPPTTLHSLLDTVHSESCEVVERTSIYCDLDCMQKPYIENYNRDHEWASDMPGMTQSLFLGIAGILGTKAIRSK